MNDTFDNYSPPESDPSFSDPAFSDPTFGRATVAPAATVAAPIEKRAADWQEATDNAVEAALVAIPESICGLPLMPFTTARGSLLRRIENEFVLGVRVGDITDPFLSIGKFLLMMTTHLPEARKLAGDPALLEDKSYDLLDTIALKDVATVVEQINAFVKGQMANQVFGSLPAAEGAESSAPKN